MNQQHRTAQNQEARMIFKTDQPDPAAGFGP